MGAILEESTGIDVVAVRWLNDDRTRLGKICLRYVEKVNGRLVVCPVMLEPGPRLMVIAEVGVLIGKIQVVVKRDLDTMAGGMVGDFEGRDAHEASGG